MEPLPPSESPAEPTPPSPPPEVAWGPRDYTVVILAVAVGTAVNFIVIAVMYDAVQAGAEISDNAVQLLSVIFGGLIGLLASYVGFVSGRRSNAPGPAGAPGEQGPPGATSTPPVEPPPEKPT